LLLFCIKKAWVSLSVTISSHFCLAFFSFLSLAVSLGRGPPSARDPANPPFFFSSRGLQKGLYSDVPSGKADRTVPFAVDDFFRVSLGHHLLFSFLSSTRQLTFSLIQPSLSCVWYLRTSSCFFLFLLCGEGRPLFVAALFFFSSSSVLLFFLLPCHASAGGFPPLPLPSPGSYEAPGFFTA